MPMDWWTRGCGSSYAAWPCLRAAARPHRRIANSCVAAIPAQVSSEYVIARCTVRGQRPGISRVSAVTKDFVGQGLRQIRSETKAFRWSCSWPLRLDWQQWSDGLVALTGGDDEFSDIAASVATAHAADDDL